jgi:MFS family permease
MVFAINIIPIAIALWQLHPLTTPPHETTRKHVDILGILLGIVALGGVVYALIEQGKYGWNSPLIYGSFVLGAVAMTAFIFHEHRTAQPMLPLSLFKTRNFSIGNLATFFVYAALSLQGFLLVIFLQQTAHFSALAAGFASFPITIIMFFLSSRFGALSGKYGPRLFMGLGPIVAGCGVLLLLTTQLPTDYWTQLLPGILLFGIGLSMTVAPLTSAILGSIHSAQAGIGSAVNNAISRIAGLLAIAAIGMFIGSSVTLHGFHQGLLMCASLLIIGGIISGLGIRNTINN